MHEYEIRVLRDDGSDALVLEVLHLNDNAAVRQAGKIADGRSFEVWRGLNCIYGVSRRDPSGYSPPNRQEA
jgi:hypothetical protein